MYPRFITRTIHAYLDYPVALALTGLPFLLGLGTSHPLALWLSVATGVAAFVLTLLTDHHLGVFRVLPYRFHLTVDFAVGLAFVLAPVALGFTGLDAAFYWINGAAVLVVVSMNKPEERLQQAGAHLIGRAGTLPPKPAQHRESPRRPRSDKRNPEHNKRREPEHGQPTQWPRGFERHQVDRYRAGQCGEANCRCRAQHPRVRAPPMAERYPAERDEAGQARQHPSRGSHCSEH